MGQFKINNLVHLSSKTSNHIIATVCVTFLIDCRPLLTRRSPSSTLQLVDQRRWTSPLRICTADPARNPGLRIYETHGVVWRTFNQPVVYLSPTYFSADLAATSTIKYHTTVRRNFWGTQRWNVWSFSIASTAHGQVKISIRHNLTNF